MFLKIFTHANTKICKCCGNHCPESDRYCGKCGSLIIPAPHPCTDSEKEQLQKDLHSLHAGYPQESSMDKNCDDVLADDDLPTDIAAVIREYKQPMNPEDFLDDFGQ